jgi:hypothetical protein
MKKKDKSLQKFEPGNVYRRKKTDASDSKGLLFVKQTKRFSSDINCCELEG